MQALSTGSDLHRDVFPFKTVVGVDLFSCVCVRERKCSELTRASLYYPAERRSDSSDLLVRSFLTYGNAADAPSDFAESPSELKSTTCLKERRKDVR